MVGSSQPSICKAWKRHLLCWAVAWLPILGCLSSSLEAAPATASYVENAAGFTWVITGPAVTTTGGFFDLVAGGPFWTVQASFFEHAQEDPMFGGGVDTVSTAASGRPSSTKAKNLLGPHGEGVGLDVELDFLNVNASQPEGNQLSETNR